MGFISFAAKLIALQAELFSQMRIKRMEATLMFWQMNNLVGLYKILMCENCRWSSYLWVFLRTYFFTIPIMLDVLHAQRGFLFSFVGCWSR